MACKESSVHKTICLTFIDKSRKEFNDNRSTRGDSHRPKLNEAAEEAP